MSVTEKETKAEEQNFLLPDKLLNDHNIKNFDNVNVLLNAYFLNLKDVLSCVYKYELKFFGIVKNCKKTKDLSKGPKNDEATQTRRAMCWELFKQMFEKEPEFFGGANKTIFRKIVYDCGTIMYSIDPLLLKDGDKKIIYLEKELLSNKSKSYLQKKIVGIIAEITRCTTVQLNNFEKILFDRDQSLIQFLEILSNQYLYEKNEYYFFGNRMFSKNNNNKSNSIPQILNDGFQKNIRLIGDSFDEACPIIQINPKKSAFFPAILITEFLIQFFSNKDRKVYTEKDLLHLLHESNNFKLALQQLKELSVITTHLNNNRIFVIAGLTNKSAEKIIFDYNGNKISVAKYFNESYGMRLRFPNQICVIQRVVRENFIQESYFPLEVLKIVDGQRVPSDKQTQQLKEKLISECRMLPNSFKKNMEIQKGNTFTSNANPFYKSHKIGVLSNLVMANAEILFPPAISYNANCVEECNKNKFSTWNFGNNQFLVPAEAPSVWVAVNFQLRCAPKALEEFIEKYVRQAERRGLLLKKPQRFDTFTFTSLEYVRKKFKFFKNNNVSFVMYFTHNKTDSIHHTMKLMEIEFKIITQNICFVTLQKALGYTFQLGKKNKNFNMILDNLLLKTNLKLGGINYGLKISREMMIKNNLTHDIVNTDFIQSNQRMFFGIDLSHASPQSLYDRQKGSQVDPSIVGMAYTMNQPLKMLGVYWVQNFRKSICLNLVDPVIKALKEFKQHTGNYPRHAVVYRSGVSEGEYRKIAFYEQKEFKDAFAVLSKTETSFCTPYLTIIVVQKTSNYRIVPQTISEKANVLEQNVKPGTLIDAKIMNPNYTEFLLVAHKTIHGTANPVRFTVIYDDVQQRLSLNILENITYSLCYAHGIVFSPISVPAPLYAASELAKRGRNNWKTKNNAKEIGFCDEKEIEIFLNNMSKILMPKFEKKFWA